MAQLANDTHPSRISRNLVFIFIFIFISRLRLFSLPKAKVLIHGTLLAY